MSDSRPFELTISPVGLQTRQSLCFRVEVKNTSNRQLVWDREFSMFLEWIVPEGTEWAAATDIDSAKPPSADRLINIEPGDTSSRLVHLSRGFLTCDFPPSEYTRTLKNGEAISLPNVREANVRFRISPSATRLLLWVRYDADGSRMDAFARTLGWVPRDHGIWMGVQESNAIGLEIKKGTKDQFQFAGSFDPWSSECQLFKTRGGWDRKE